MARTRQLSVSRTNLLWLIVVLCAAAIGFVAGGWKIALLAAALSLVASEVFERRARARRRVG